MMMMMMMMIIIIIIIIIILSFSDALEISYYTCSIDFKNRQ